MKDSARGFAPTFNKRRSQNAIRHGIFVRLVLSGSDFQEHEEDFTLLLQSLRVSIKPVGGLEAVLVEKLAFSFLRLSRLFKADAKLAPKIFEKVDDVLEQAEPGVAEIYLFDERRQVVHVDTPRPDLLLRYESAIERQIERTLNQIERLQRMRSGLPVSAPVRVELTT